MLIVVLCGVVFVVVLCGVAFLFLRCSLGSDRQIFFDQLQIQSMTKLSTMKIRRHEYFGNFYFVTLFVGLSMPFYAINSDAVSLFADSSFSFLALLNLCLLFEE